MDNKEQHETLQQEVYIFEDVLDNIECTTDLDDAVAEKVKELRKLSNEVLELIKKL